MCYMRLTRPHLCCRWDWRSPPDGGRKVPSIRPTQGKCGSPPCPHSPASPLLASLLPPLLLPFPCAHLQGSLQRIMTCCLLWLPCCECRRLLLGAGEEGSRVQRGRVLCCIDCLHV